MFIQGATCNQSIRSSCETVFLSVDAFQFVFMMLLGSVLFLDSDKMPSEGMLENITFSVNRNWFLKKCFSTFPWVFAAEARQKPSAAEYLRISTAEVAVNFKTLQRLSPSRQVASVMMRPAASLPRAEVRDRNCSLLLFHFSAAAINPDLWNIFPMNRPARL